MVNTSSTPLQIGAEHDELHTLLGQDSADLDRVEAHRAGGGSSKRTVARISMSVLVTAADYWV